MAGFRPALAAARDNAGRFVINGETIAALTTAPGTAAVAIVRLSGARAREIAVHVARIEPAPRRAELCRFTTAAGEPIDQGLLLYFPAPASYTGEDVVEFQLHGGRIVTDWLLETVYELGARPAEPGEFTLRAFLNDKLDLAQAEAVADLIDSGSRRAATAALRSLTGDFSAVVARLQTELTALRVQVEAWLDFPDEEIDRDTSAALCTHTVRVEAGVRGLLVDAARGRTLRDGLSIVIAGPPNAGKSSLLNRLAGYDAAIVTTIAGTTRDTLREHLSLDGLPVNIVDTAGLRQSADPVEIEGVRRARGELARADHALWLADIRDGIEGAVQAAHAELPPELAFTVILNKADLLAGPTATPLASVPILALSALTGAGCDALIAHLKALAGFAPGVEGSFTARRRHVAALTRAAEHLAAAQAELAHALELGAEELRLAQVALSELTGELTSDDLLGEIFSKFCLGK